MRVGVATHGSVSSAETPLQAILSAIMYSRCCSSGIKCGEENVRWENTIKIESRFFYAILRPEVQSDVFFLLCRLYIYWNVYIFK